MTWSTVQNAASLSAAQLTLQQVSTVSEIIYYVVAAVAILVAGWWALFLRRRHRTDAWSLNVVISTEVTPYAVGASLLTVRVSLENVGKVVVQPGKNGCRMSVRQVPAGLAPATVIHWGADYPVVLEPFDLLQQYRRDERTGELALDYVGSYALEPGATYREQAGLIVQDGFSYLIQVRFWWSRDDDRITEYTTAFVPTRSGELFLPRNSSLYEATPSSL
jgi:hypothetical protein